MRNSGGVRKRHPASLRREGRKKGETGGWDVSEAEGRTDRVGWYGGTTLFVSVAEGKMQLQERESPTSSLYEKIWKRVAGSSNN